MATRQKADVANYGILGRKGGGYCGANDVVNNCYWSRWTTLALITIGHYHFVLDWLINVLH